jgi:hypothetical protein
MLLLVATHLVACLAQRRDGGAKLFDQFFLLLWRVAVVRQKSCVLGEGLRLMKTLYQVLV